MATVTVAYRWPGGDILTVTISVNESYPDAIDQARGQARIALTEALAALDTLRTEGEPDAGA